MSQEALRQVRIDNLRRAQETRRDESLERTYEAIKQLQKAGGKINFQRVAEAANVSVSYLYKYPELKQHIADLRNKQSLMPRQPLVKPASSGSQAKIIGRLKARVRQLEEQNQELRRKNEALAGQVYRAHFFEDQVTRQKQTIQDLESRLNAVRSQAPLTSTSKVTPITQGKTHFVSNLIGQEIEQSGVRLTESLKRAISQYDETRVLLAVQAYNQYKEMNTINSPGGCLRKAIEQGWVPNETLILRSPEEDEFDQFYTAATRAGFLLDVPKNHLTIERGEWVVKINRPSLYGPWTPVNWREARLEFEELIEFQ